MSEECRLITAEELNNLNKKISELSSKALQLEKKLELCKGAMQTIIDNSGEFATKQLLSGVLEKVK